MKIGLPKEIKNNESRVAMTPAIVKALVKNNHEVYVEHNAGIEISISDQMYVDAGAKIVDLAKEAWEQEMVVKVKEPQASEFEYFHEGLILFTYLHLSAEEKLFQVLLEKKVIAIGYETVQIGNSTPLLRPMSEIAGRRSVQVGAMFLEKTYGGRGLLLSSVPGVHKTNVVVVGGGIAGTNAAMVAAGFNANVTILEINENKIRDLYEKLPTNVEVLKSNEENIYQSAKKADLLISTVLIPGAKAPKLVKEYMVKEMKNGSVIVDISIDQGGSVETVDRVTTHDDPIFVKHGVLHYSVANMPGVVPESSTYALTNATSSYILEIANKGVQEAIKSNESLRKGVNTYLGKCLHPVVGKTFNVDVATIEKIF